MTIAKELQVTPWCLGVYCKMVPAKHKVDIPCLAVKFYGAFLSVRRMGQIALVVFLFLCYNIHGD